MDNNIKYYLLLHGHDLNDISFSLSKELGDYIENVIKTDRYHNLVYFDNITENKIIKKSKSYLNKFFNIHDVGYLNEEMVKDSINGAMPLSLDDAANLYNESCIMMSPFKIPIIYTDKSKMHASLEILSPDVDNLELLKKINIYFQSIKLNNNMSSHLIPMYIHEIVHTQLESNKGVITDIKNKEVLSVFLELLYTYHHNVNEYRYFLNERLNSLMGDFNNVCKYAFKGRKVDVIFMITLSYLVSTVKALNLLDTYINSNILVKKEILKSIQKVFDADNTLEDFLDKYEIDYKNSLDPKILSRIVK